MILLCIFLWFRRFKKIFVFADKVIKLIAWHMKVHFYYQFSFDEVKV